jgi:sec-independent protein translocase protein TatC
VTEAVALARMPLVQHLRELRTRVAVSALSYLVGVATAYALWEPIYGFLRQPYCATSVGSKSCDLFVLGVFDSFQVRMRVAFLAGAVISAPVWTFQIGRFITPALHRKEKRYAALFSVAGLTLFGAGVATAYLTVAHGLQVFLDVGGSHVLPLVTLQSYLSFLTLLMMGFGLAFQFPLVVLFLNVVGILSADRMRRSRRTALFAVLLVSAILVPTTDPFTFLAMGLPLALLYELCIVVARARERRQPALSG